SYPPSGDKNTREIYEEVAHQAVSKLATTGGGKIFLGPRDDPFFFDRGAFFDLLQIRGGAPGGTGKGGGIDFHAGYNVHTIALQVPISALTSDGSDAPAHGKISVVGVWTTASRGNTQLSRRGLPLIKELFIPAAE